MNVALAAATQWLFNLIVSRTVPNMLATVGEHGYGTYLIFGSFCFSMFFFVWFFVPETKGVSLEAMDRLFGVTDYDKQLPPEAEERKREATDVQIENTTKV
jgi:Sugar (and other) transporter